jgi:hypothetical protein
VEGPHRQRQLDGLEPDGAGAKHRGGDHSVAKGDLSRKITVDVKGEILELKNTINTMVDQLNSFAAEVTRVAKEVGTEGKLGGQADVKDVSRHVEGPHRQRQFHGLEPHDPGARHRARRRPRSPTATSPRSLKVDAKGEIASSSPTPSTP